mmetsp:Transcript_31875/g.85217  ORF Transcript_31875/g.85217 Transcript_31875/m.85217 type:complete len:202 (-) Transcript_31875:231-836(-)
MHEIVSTDWAQLCHERVLVVVFVAIGVVRHEMLGSLYSCGCAALHEVCEALRMTLVREMEIQTLPTLFQLQNLLVHIVLENQLLEVAKGTTMLDFLPQLYDRIGKVWSVRPSTIFALLINHLELHHHSLLQNRRIRHFFLHRQLHLDSFRVLLSPNEVGIHKPDVLVDPLNFSQTNAEQLSGFGLASRPRRLIVAATTATT